MTILKIPREDLYMLASENDPSRTTERKGNAGDTRVRDAARRIADALAAGPGVTIVAT